MPCAAAGAEESRGSFPCASALSCAAWRARALAEASSSSALLEVDVEGEVVLVTVVVLVALLEVGWFSSSSALQAVRKIAPVESTASMRGTDALGIRASLS
ncbi:hypothetical protein [Corynebacterium mastitidis]|uniref:hypothetical protein n=1 Tax=Corynebacterium mastitidis TaxID=161890 RepID=UPI002550E2D2|nr:hypothetical protein [Corynebacterium mastitidis]MDK8451011.1 hypothetical protein [Corynebacterium mastitidis]